MQNFPETQKLKVQISQIFLTNQNNLMNTIKFADGFDTATLNEILLVTINKKNV